MGKTYEAIPDNIINWIRKQEVFWVATAPLSGDGHVNVSPKGLRGTFFVEGPSRVWYEDLSGSGCETIAHLRENGRITIQLCAFDGPPQIVRLFGEGAVYEFGSAEYDARIPTPQRKAGSRAVIIIDVHRVGTSCGWGVPFMAFEGHRKLMMVWSQKLERNDRNFESGAHDDDAECENGMKHWWKTQNASSVDGLPGLLSASNTSRTLNGIMPDLVEGAFRQGPPKRAHTQPEVPANVLVRKVDMANANVRLVYGIMIGFLASFILGDIISAARRVLHS